MGLRIGQVVVDGPSEEVLVLPRLKDDIVIYARAVTDMSDFEAMCPAPVPPKKLMKGGFQEDTESEGYIQAIEKHSNLRFAYICLKSLEPSDIDWQKVKMDSPSSWLKWDEELREAGLSQVEINHIVRAVMVANSLDEAKLKKARDSFVLGMQQQSAELSSRSTERPSTPSGVPAKDSE